MRGSNCFSFPCKDFPQILTSPEVGFVKPNSMFIVVDVYKRQTLARTGTHSDLFGK